VGRRGRGEGRGAWGARGRGRGGKGRLGRRAEANGICGGEACKHTTWAQRIRTYRTGAGSVLDACLIRSGSVKVK
jgi:hypothetical protein